ncbi:hypothetical protein A3H78_01370 [Candidatus Roizmanbacteria bacterium RIFCSPLOWO2_02_FULL_36_11]|uniref:Glycosyltransferase 2-like domain-containing protein n=1 Tax=Candidatus Roizmanbacteria bacterium RIFCSPLOWO2_02_FULL_36_11 TaxID=1802071 RepID=A0A1F7JFB5_9BACT|nr:MAG: hypothetical protein A3H78_01370 [Candidatus Roizmanbacteria bacterium RIFCSPLOWO2_02_FULL_36_11]
MKITAIVVINDYPKHVEESIDSVITHVDELIIGDINMKYKIPNKYSEKNIKVIKLDESIPYADLIKEDLKEKANGEYIFYFDPDEVIPGSTWKILEKKSKSYDYFLIPRKNIIFNKWIKNSRWWPDYQIRFFKKNKVIWPKKLHPKPKVNGKEYKIEAKEKLAIIHYNYENLSQYFEKALRYSKSEAEQIIKQGEDLSLSNTIVKALSEFVSRFYAAEGYKDGMHGFVLAFLQMFYYFFVYFFYWEKKSYIEVNSDRLNKDIYLFFKDGLRNVTYWLINKKLVKKYQSIKLKFLNRLLK